MQIGCAFGMYAADFDDTLPTPGGRKEFTTFGSCESPENGWVQSAAPGQNKDVGGIFPYVRSRTNNPSTNLWSCTYAIPGKDHVFSPGQNYVMNDYVRLGHPGQAVTSPGACKCGSATIPCAGYFDGASMGGLPNPSQLILIYEAAQRKDGWVDRNGSLYFSEGTASAHPPMPANAPTVYHLGRSNWLFVDGHVKSLRIEGTWCEDERRQMQNIGYYNSALAEVLVKRLKVTSGGGQVDMWDPQLPRVVYP
ncbi:MAG: H-X9-DG-CTERM domain-containing protein [Armatimonadota bacterium]